MLHLAFLYFFYFISLGSFLFVKPTVISNILSRLNVRIYTWQRRGVKIFIFHTSETLLTNKNEHLLWRAAYDRCRGEFGKLLVYGYPVVI